MSKIALVLCSKVGFGGAERRLLRIYGEIAARGRQIDLIFQASAHMDTKKIMEEHGINYTSFHNVKYCLTRRQFVKACLNNKYKVMHFVDDSWLWLIITVLARLRGTKIIESIANLDVVQNKVHAVRRKRAHAVWKLASHIDLLYPNYENVVCYYKKKEKITCTPGTFTDLNLFVPKEKQKLLFFCAARLQEVKGANLLVSAVCKVAALIRDNEYEVVIAGKGEQEAFLQNFICENSLQDIIHLVGYVAPQTYMEYAEVVFSLQPYNYPSQVVAEAAASGCCVVTTESSGNTGTFLDESFAIFCDRTETGIAQGICRYLQLSDAKKMQMQKAARIHAENNFCIHKSIIYFENILTFLEQ